SRFADGSGVTVAVIDSGVSADHPQLHDSVAAGHDYIENGDGREDCAGHGTAVASIIAARPVTGSGLLGLAPGVRILPIRLSEQQDTDGGPTGRHSHDPAGDCAAAIQFAVDQHARVINLSLVLK